MNEVEMFEVTSQEEDNMVKELRDYMLECYLWDDLTLVLTEPEFKLLLRQVKDMCFELENGSVSELDE